MEFWKKNPLIYNDNFFFVDVPTYGFLEVKCLRFISCSLIFLIFNILLLLLFKGT